MTASSTGILYTRLTPQGEGKKVRSLLAGVLRPVAGGRAGSGFSEEVVAEIVL